jgi:hypothetical protein
MKRNRRHTRLVPAPVESLADSYNLVFDRG